MDWTLALVVTKPWFNFGLKTGFLGPNSGLLGPLTVRVIGLELSTSGVESALILRSVSNSVRWLTLQWIRLKFKVSLEI